MKLRNFISIGKEVERAQEAAFDLWTWLPSCNVAKKHHGEYYSEHTPEFAYVMIEAAMWIAHPEGSVFFTEEEREWFERCPCGESHKEA